MKEKLLGLSKSIGVFIQNWILENNGFDCRSFYGETFTLNLLSQLGLLDQTSKRILIASYESLDKSDPEFHWEFNNYAISQYYMTSNDKEILQFIEPLKFKNTACTNWTLLRSNTRLSMQKDVPLAIKEAKEKINKYQLKSGLILDDPGVKSFQYHCFSMAMIGEVYERTGDEYFKSSFLRGVEFIRNFILSNGETLYIGRGQNQSFGYGVLIYILALAYNYTNNKTVLGDLELILDFLKKHQKEDGSFPLVMSRLEKSIPQVVDMQNSEFTGWYPYNNYFDYLPFMGFFITKAYEILKDLNISDIQYKKQEYRDESFIKIVKPNYEAVLSRPGGYWTNDLPIPYIMSNNKNITSCYGGEQFQKSLYSLEGIPLPFCKTLKKSIRWRSISFFRNDTLWIVSPLGIMKRVFVFENESVEVKTKIFSPFKFKHIYLFLEADEKICNEINSMKFEEYEYSASGKLKKYTYENQKSIIKIRIVN